MSEPACSLLRCGLQGHRNYGMDDYAGPVARWCPGCGDHAVLAATERLLVARQLQPETTVFVSGIGCSSRFPHYLNTYGFHGIHGRALPVATGIKLHRPDLDVFAVMGDGDCCSIGAGHWVHAVRYNVDMVALLLDNEIYGLTKDQTSPTTPRGFPSMTQPRGTYLTPMNPIEVTLGIANASFVAQTADWIPAHLSATLEAAYRHRGFAFVRVLQRCPQYTSELFERAVRQPEMIELMVHPNGISAPSLDAIYKARRKHDPADLDEARRLAEHNDKLHLGLFYANERLPRYEETRHVPSYTAEQRAEMLGAELDRYGV